ATELTDAARQVVTHGLRADLEGDAGAALLVGEATRVQAAPDDDRIADPHRLVHVLGEVAPAGDPQEELVTVDPAAQLRVETAGGGGDLEVGHGTALEKSLHRFGADVSHDGDMGVVHGLAPVRKM